MPYSAAWWLPGPHLQTLWGKLMRRDEPHVTRIERLDTPDGDFLDIHHLDSSPGAPLLVLLHGLEGGVRSHYIQGLLGEASRRGWRAAVLIFRSCGEELNRTRRFYHSGETSDLGFALEHLTSLFPDSPLVLAGVSLGGNVLLKFLGEQGAAALPQIRAAAAVSVPYDLSRAARHIDRGFAKVYQRSFIRSLQSKAIAKLERFPDLVPRDRIGSIRTMNDFDDILTAPLHGFKDAEDYYARSSAIGWLNTISINTLLLSSVDDPFLPSEVLDQVGELARKNPCLHIEFTPHGGHVGFVEGSSPFRPRYYLERRVGDFLAEHLSISSSNTDQRRAW
jgi:predicted alpha/beta-fold hydrolase